MKVHNPNTKLHELVRSFEEAIINREKVRSSGPNSMKELVEDEYLLAKSALTGIIMAADFQMFGDLKGIVYRLDDTASELRKALEERSSTESITINKTHFLFNYVLLGFIIGLLII